MRAVVEISRTLWLLSDFSKLSFLEQCVSLNIVPNDPRGDEPGILGYGVATGQKRQAI